MTDERTTAELVKRHNELAIVLGRDTITAWKKKSLLAAHVEVMGREAAEKEPARTIRQAAIELLCHVDHHEDRDEPSGPDNVVSGDHEGARSVGLPYDEVIRRIMDEFLPLGRCETTVACLRWYAVKIRVEEHGYEGLRLPQRRPRVKSKKEA